MTLAEIETLVRSSLNESTEDILTAGDMLNAINDGYKEVTSRAFCIENEENVVTVEGSRDIVHGGSKVNYVRQDNASGWYIDGVEWTGAIRTVGVDKDFTTIIAAVADADLVPEDCLYLIDAGTYDAPTGSVRYCYFRGLGATAADTIIDGATNFSATAPGHLFIENVWIYLRKASGNGPTLYIGDGSSLLTSNKAIIGNAAAFPAPGVQWPISTGTTYTNTISLNYTKIIPTYTGGYNVHLMGANRANIFLTGVSWVDADTPGWRDYGCINVLAVDDKALDGTAGYGPNYGSFRITQGAVGIKSLLKIRPEACGYVTESGYPQYWFQWGNRVVIEPVPDDVYTLTLFTAGEPASELTSTDEPNLPEEFQLSAVDFACYVLSLKLKKWEQAARFYNQYITNLKIRRKEYIEKKAEPRLLHHIPDNVNYQGGAAWAH
jgi:hypothetical protein